VETTLTRRAVPNEVVDVDGGVWVLDGHLGGGGQGDVYSVVGHRCAVKIVDCEEDKPLTRKRINDELAAVRLMALEGLPVAQPGPRLREPRVGYVMELFDGMHLLDDLIPSKRRLDIEKIDIKTWYLRTGGLQRRLRILARLADVLERLHSDSIIYADLSLTNVLISEDPTRDLIRLIDLDNLRTSGAEARWVTTEPFGAPELYRRGPSLPDTLTDAHSLAVVIYQVLTLKHPLLGRWSVEDDPNLEHAALLGEMPWADDIQGICDEQAAGIPPTMVLPKRALELARRTFGPGLAKPGKRAGAGEWAKELRWAADMCLHCPRCRQTYLAPEHPSCPWCGEPRPRLLIVSVRLRAPNGSETTDNVRPHLVATAGDTVHISRFEAFRDRAISTQDTPVADIRFEDDHITYTPAVAGTAIGEHPADPRPVSPGQTEVLPVPQTGLLPLAIHFGTLGAKHYVARLQLVAGSRA
jgi:eukaryotic-like serine/threonine-protein kinase